jgi:5-enolpyruvylshikimate-3-phosphate synthase
MTAVVDKRRVFAGLWDAAWAHRRRTLLAMAFLVLGMAAEEQVTVDDQSAIAQIYPGFMPDFEQLGASFLRYT